MDLAEGFFPLLFCQGSFSFPAVNPSPSLPSYWKGQPSPNDNTPCSIKAMEQAQLKLNSKSLIWTCMNFFFKKSLYHPFNCSIPFTCVWFGTTLAIKALAKKRKVDAVCCVVQEKLRNLYFSVEQNGKSTCLICLWQISLPKEYNIWQQY